MRVIVILLISLVVSPLFGQSKKDVRKAANKERPKFLELGFGSGSSYYRDFATAPIFYHSIPQNVAIHYHRFDSLKETRYGGNLSFGIYDFEIGDQKSSSLTRSLNLDFGKLYHIQKLSTEKYNVKVGGMAIFTGNLRIDQDLQNAAVGYEFIYNLMASAKVSRDVSRKETKSGKIWFIKWNWEPRKRLLSYRLNVGLMNSHIRNAYPYINQKEILNESPFFANYENTFFQGFRMTSDLDYTIFLHNNNAIRFSYVWDAYTTGQEVDKFEMANHFINFSLLFRL